jgi:tetratricopeptide (TPR) repeat protein
MILGRMGWRYSLAFVLLVVGLPLREAAALEVTEAYAALQHAFLREEFQAAAALAHTFLIEHPDAPEAARVRIWQALSLDRLERAPEALEALDGLRARLSPDDPLWAEALYWEGDICRRTFQLMRAKSSFQRLLERYADSSWAPMAQLGLGLVYTHQQAFELARQRFHQLALQKAGSPIALEALLYEGFCNVRLRRFEEAVNLLQPLLEPLDDSAEAQAAFYLGEAFTGFERYGDAIEAYQRAIKSAESSTWAQLAQFGAGWAGFRAGRCEESIEAFERYLSLGLADHRTEALFAQASCLSQVGRQREALSLFGRVLERDPDHPLAVESGLILVDAYRQQERFTPAKQLLHTLLRRRLDARARAHVQLRLAAVALDQGNAAQAQTVYQLAAESDDPTVRQAALSGLGDIQIFLGNLEEAQRLYEEAVQSLKDTPGAMRATYQLGRIHLQRRAFDKAAAIFRRLVEQRALGLADDARLALALTVLNQGQTDAARAQLEAIRGQRPASLVAARAGYYVALLKLEEGEEETAERLCRETIARAPRAEEAADARLLLADVLARRTSVRDAMDWLAEVSQSAGMPWRHRARIAKRIGDFAREEGDYVAAIRWYDEAMRLLPSLRGEATYRTASCYEDGGDHELAMRWYQAVSQSPWTIRSQLALAKLLERHDRLQEAQAIYELLAHEPIPEAAVVRERLAALRGASVNEE